MDGKIERTGVRQVPARWDLVDSQALNDKVYDDVGYFVLRIAISLCATIQPVVVPRNRACRVTVTSSDSSLMATEPMLSC